MKKGVAHEVNYRSVPLINVLRYTCAGPYYYISVMKPIDMKMVGNVFLLDNSNNFLACCKIKTNTLDLIYCTVLFTLLKLSNII